MKTLIQFVGEHLASVHLRRRARVVAVYLAGQGIVQLITLVIGLFMMRWLVVAEYAQFSLAFSFQTTFTMLTDLGITATITALVGRRIHNAAVVGEYVRSGRHVRNLMLLLLSPFALLFYAYIARLHHWAAGTSALLFGAIVFSVYASGVVSCFSPALLINRQLSSYYRYNLAGVLARGLGTTCMYFLHWLNAWAAAWINAAGIFLQGLLSRRKAAQFAILPLKTNPAITRQMFNYAMPNIPSMIFYSLQGQVSIYLISIYGSTRNIAEVGALGRLGQVFLLLSTFNPTVIEPFMARQARHRVLRYYLLILSVAIAICAIISLAGFLEPQWILWLIGPNYAKLRHEVGWLMLSSCFSYLIGVVWYMSTARRWVYWSTSWLTIAMIVAAQAIFLSLVRIDSTLHAIYFMASSTAAHLLAMLINSIYGFFRGPRIKIDDDFELHPEQPVELL